MDIVELGKIFMDDVRKSLENEFGVTLEADTSFYNLRDGKKPSRISVSNFTATAQDYSSDAVIHYEFLKKLGEIGTYLKFSKTPDGNVSVIHARCIRDDEELFAIMSEGAILSNFSGGLSAEDIIEWSYPFYGITLEETLNLLRRKGNYTFEKADAEYALGVKADGIVSTIEALSKQVEEKLSINPSR